MINNSMKEDLKEALKKARESQGGNRNIVENSSVLNSDNQPVVKEVEKSNPIPEKEVSHDKNERALLIEDNLQPAIIADQLKKENVQAEVSQPEHKPLVKESVLGERAKKMQSEKKKKFISLPKVKTKVLLAAVVVVIAIISSFAYLQNKKNTDKGTTVNNNAAAVADNSPEDKNAEEKAAIANDVLRRKNLETITNTTIVYCLEEKVDLPISPNYTKLNENNPVSELVKEALKKYEKSEDLLIDPREPDFYFAYKSSDGRNIEFTARMEEKNSLYCEEEISEGYCLFKEVLSEEDVNEMGADLEKYK